MPEPWEILEWRFDDAMVAYGKAKTPKAKETALKDALFALEDLTNEIDRMYEELAAAKAA